MDNNEERAKKILKDADIDLSIGGCGCCGSPWFTIKYKGEIIMKDENCHFHTEVDPDE